MSRHTYEKVGSTLKWFIRIEENSLFAEYFTCSAVVVKMGEFYKHSLLV